MASFSLAENATAFFHGGITAYNLGQKTRQLCVDPIHAESTNCVSDVIAQQMACGVAKQFCCHWGIGVTGYAVPIPALDIHTCFAFYSFSHQGKPVVTKRIESVESGQYNVQMFFTGKIIESFLDHIKK
jgi:nicotinamide mononucleotide (NMN) deamidase PncC